ncbi:MAG: IPExxxVDY family protein [Bacteroidetes bacterium]|nr:IPExxxVDY family protein [Bacteroidota bacterium]
MVTHKLNLESEVDDQDVVCVHTVLPSYLFVFQLNRLLGLSLFRSKEDVAIRAHQHKFAVYEYNCDVMQQTWRVLENQITATQNESENSLFAQSEQRFYLFPELEQADLLVCVNGLTDAVLKKIQSIGRVISCYRLPINVHNIKEQLTF